MIAIQVALSGSVPDDVAARVLRDVRRLTGGAAEDREPDVRICPSTRTVLRNGRPISLTRREFDLLLRLCQRRRVYTREELLATVWGHTWIGGTRTIDVHVRRLRVKLGESLPLVDTVIGVGYRLARNAAVAIEPASAA
ncbi:winged helix-turn-helix domain-containing protein [Micromonospora sp. CPCC 205371]|nr:winged helix-turn-helix domain-containing protein [Micromonospora sp. CPCC 205371]